mgnify:CR=1 FL=1
MRDPDGSVSYTWESDEKQTAKSPPAPAASDASDGDLVNRGIEKAKNGDLDGAIADFDRAAELDPKDDAPYYNRAQAKRLKNDTAGAIADYTKAIELGSTNPAAYNNRGNARAENKDRDGAIADYTRAIELKPDYARAYYNRAMLKKEKGDAAGAAADFKRAQKLDPDLVSEGSAAGFQQQSRRREWRSDRNNSQSTGRQAEARHPVGFSRDADDPKSPKTLAKFSGPDGAWGEVLRGTHGLTPDKLDGYLQDARGRIQQRLQLATEGFAPAMAEERHRDHRWPQVGGLALRSDAKRNEGLLTQPRLHALPNHFLQRPAVRDHLYLEPEHRTRVKAEDRSHHGLGASRRMRDTNFTNLH